VYGKVTVTENFEKSSFLAVAEKLEVTESLEMNHHIGSRQSGVQQVALKVMSVMLVACACEYPLIGGGVSSVCLFLVSQDSLCV